MTDPVDRTWMSHAKCADTPVNFFFPGKGEGILVDVAKRFCHDCPVKGACLKAALAISPHPVGVWGGTSHKERVRIKNGKMAMPVWAA